MFLPDKTAFMLMAEAEKKKEELVRSKDSLLYKIPINNNEVDRLSLDIHYLELYTSACSSLVMDNGRLALLSKDDMGIIKIAIKELIKSKKDKIKKINSSLIPECFGDFFNVEKDRDELIQEVNKIEKLYDSIVFN